MPAPAGRTEPGEDRSKTTTRPLALLVAALSTATALTLLPGAAGAAPDELAGIGHLRFRPPVDWVADSGDEDLRYVAPPSTPDFGCSIRITAPRAGTGDPHIDLSALEQRTAAPSRAAGPESLDAMPLGWTLASALYVGTHRGAAPLELFSFTRATTTQGIAVVYGRRGCRDSIDAWLESIVLTDAAIGAKAESSVASGR